MPIKKRIAQVAAAKSTSTHGGNENQLNIEQGENSALNHMSVDTLTDPEDYEGGDTHTSVTAGKKVKAADESTNVGTLDQEVDPAAGYLENAAAEGPADDELADDDEEVNADFDMGDDEDEVTADTLENNNATTPLVADADDEPMADDWDVPPPDGAGGTEHAEEDIEEAEGIETPEEEVVAEPEDLPGTGNELSMLDVDETPDDATQDVAFASFGTRLMVIKAHRIIATMTQRMALASGREDVYLTDQFQEVAASELHAKGLRRGLRGMGFTLAKVNVAKTAVVNARVQLEVTKTTAAVRKVAASKEAAFQQSLTIAAVGINRRYFNEQPNELRAHLEAELTRAGMRGAGKLLQRAFAAHGPAYAKTIVELANKISAMPQESRDGFVSALDLTSEDMDVGDDEEVIPVGADGAEAVYGEDDEDEGIAPAYEGEDIAASLAIAGVRRPVVAATKPGQYSLTASAILNGDRPLF